MIARVIKTNEMVNVKQVEKGSLYFMDEKNNPYHCNELDFSAHVSDVNDSQNEDGSTQSTFEFPSIYSTFNEFNKSMEESRKSQREQEESAYAMRMKELRADFTTSMMLDFVEKMDKVPTQKELDSLIAKCEYIADKFFINKKS